jgi:hypothetical protein
MRLIPLTNSSRMVKVSSKDFRFLSSFNWHLTKDGYASRNNRPNILMHKLILEVPAKREVDHRDLDGLNNLEEILDQLSTGRILQTGGNREIIRAALRACLGPNLE